MVTKTAKKKTKSSSKKLAPVPKTKAGECIHWIRTDPDKILGLLPNGMDPERFKEIILAEIGGNQKIQNCNPRSIYDAARIAAKMGLAPGIPNNGDLVAYGEECKFLPGYKGLISYLVGKGTVTSINAEIVRQRDSLVGSNVKGVVHEFDCRAKRALRGNMDAVYTVILHTNGERETVALMSEEQVYEVREKSMSFKKGFGPWHGSETDKEEMWKKTSIIRACKNLSHSAVVKEIIHEVFTSDSVLMDADYEVHEVSPDEASPQGSDAVADKLEATARERREADAMDVGDGPVVAEVVPEGSFKCRECKKVFDLGHPHATAGTIKTCGKCAGMDEE